MQQPATVYPYPYPPQTPAVDGYPQHSIVYPYQNHNPNYAAPPYDKTKTLRRLFFLTVLLIPILLLIVAIIAEFTPDSPDVYITSLSVSGFNVSGDNLLSGTWDLQLQFRNPNSKTAFRYKSSDFSLYYRRVEFLAGTRLPPFEQGKNEQTQVNATVSVSGTYVEDRFADSIARERAAKGIVEFDLELLSSYSYRFGLFPKSMFLSVYCFDVAIGVPASVSSGKMVGPALRCETHTT